MPNQKPILFSAPMVQAILEGRKTQTRRVCKSPLYLLGGQDIENSAFQKDDILWVRETWAGQHRFDHLPPCEIPVKTNIHYAATEDLGGLMKRPSIFLPNWAARIWLDVTNVRVERVQEISDSDAEAEGFKRNDIFTALGNFLEYWDQLNEKRGYGVEVNPWVWVYEFKKVEAPDAESNQ